MTNELQNFVEKLTQRIDIERIYYFTIPSNDGDPRQKPQLLLLVNPVKGMAPSAFAPIVSLCMSDLEEEIPFEMIITGEWSNKVKQGSLYYTYASLPDHLIYASKPKPNILFSHKNINGLLELAQHNYDRAKTISDEFRAGIDNFLNKEDYTQASYMLHQFVETRLKAFKASAIGSKPSKSHNLEQLFKKVRGSIPTVQDIFSYDDLQRELLRKLDQSYVKTLKWQQIDISKEEFEVLLHKCEMAKEEMDKYIALMLSCITEYRDQQEAEQMKLAEELSVCEQAEHKNAKKPAPSQAVKTIVLEDFASYPWLPQYTTDVNKLLDKIRTKHNPEQITMLNYHTGGFSGGSPFQQEQEERGETKVELYLVVIMKNTGPFYFKRMQVGAVSVMVLYLNTSYIERKLAEGDRFVNTLWTKGRVLRRKSSFEPKFEITAVDWKKEYEEAERIVENAKVCMNNLYGMLSNSSSVKLDSAFLVLRNLYEIGVNTYNRCSISYLPSRLSLDEQMDWSGMFDRDIIDFIYPDSDLDNARMMFILNKKSVWWQNIEAGISRTCKPEYREVAREVKRFFEKQLEKTVEQLKQRVEPKKAEVISD